jgi:cation diffusion facilitator CzcD-associated flavoprotein CzcO
MNADFLQDIFKGQILHSIQHNKASDHIGKKVVVVGACTSGTLLSSLSVRKSSYA